jgi:hypothetical protein
MDVRSNLKPDTWARLAKKVEADNPNRIDFECNFLDFDVNPQDEGNPGSLFTSLDGQIQARPLTDRAYRQYLARLGIPHKIATLFSGSLQKQMIGERLVHPDVKTDKQIFVRTRPENVRAILSDRYGDIRDLEVVELMDQLMPSLDGYHVLKGVASDALFSVTLLGDDPVHSNGDRYFPIHVIRNSEVGASSFNITSGVCKGACSNGMIFGLRKDCNFRIRHLGTKMRENVHAIFNQVFSNVSRWGELVAPAIEKAKAVVINLEDEKQAAKAVKRLRDRGVTKKNAVQILEFAKALPQEVYGDEFTQGAKITQWHVINAMTHLAQTGDQFDEFQRHEIEAAAGALLLAA